MAWSAGIGDRSQLSVYTWGQWGQVTAVHTWVAVWLQWVPGASDGRSWPLALAGVGDNFAFSSPNNLSTQERLRKLQGMFNLLLKALCMLGCFGKDFSLNIMALP